jgi:lipopolysaccharide heptosyltransferase II
MSDHSSWQNARRVLCVRLDTLGDVLMTSPAIRALKESLQEGRITLLTSPAGEEPGRHLPEVDDVLVYEAPWMKASPARADSRYDQAMIARLRGQFDAAVIFTVYSQNPLPAALLCFLAEIPLRLAHCRENPYHLLSHWVREIEPETTVRHEVRRQLDLVASIGCRPADERLRFAVPAGARATALEKLQTAGVALDRPYVVVHPGVSAPSRQWAPQGFAAAAGRLAREDGLQIVFTGSQGEADLVEGIRAGMDAASHTLAGQLSLGELGAVLQSAALLIANNTGPVHVAAAVGTPVVDLYALTNPQHTPWGVPNRVLNHDVPCKFCYKSICPEGHHHCLALVQPDEVVQAARALLAENAARGSSSPAVRPGEVLTHP